MQNSKDTAIYEKIYEVTRRIPEGQVATYGQIAQIVGSCTARMVGYAMSALNASSDVPWQRVINSQGKISIREGYGGEIQQKLLEDEGVRFDNQGKVDLKRYGWQNSEREFNYTFDDLID
jgi:methylated-DNA-protein-cysteine methyltransferase-like protein